MSRNSNNIRVKKIIKYFVIVIITAVVTFFGLFLFFGGDISRIAEQISLIKKVCTIDTKMNNNALYFNADSKTVESEIAKTYVDLLKNDKYAAYFSDEEMQQRDDDKQGKSSKSIGISYAKKKGEDYPTVLYVNRNSPAQKAGIKAGDKIIKINGQLIKGENLTKASDIIKSKAKAELTLKRQNKILSINVTLGEYVSDSVIWRMIDKVCVIKITEFEDSTVSQFDEAISFANKNNAKALIFDLRNNPGGYVNDCAQILDKICPSGDLVRMKDKSGNQRVIYKSDDEEIKLPMAVLINGQSASAAEIFAMNIKDYNKGKLIGEKTFGKGIAQTTFRLSDNSGIKFTTETVIDKNGKTYHEIGINPDIEIVFNDEQNENYLFLTDDEDVQLKKALEVVNQ